MSEYPLIVPAALREMAERMGFHVVTSGPPSEAEEIKANINRRLRESHERA